MAHPSACASPFVSKLSSQIRCPVCGQPRSDLSTASVGSLDNIMTVATFDCAAIFAANSQGVEVHTPCPSGSDLAAALMTKEAKS